MPPVTADSTCTGVNVKTVNTGEKPRDLRIVSPTTRDFTLAAGQALDENLPVQDGSPMMIFWGPVGFEPGPPAAVLGIYTKPGNCNALPGSGGSGGSLPTTGTSTWLVASAGGLLLLLGIGLFMLTHKRRREPIA